MLLRSKLARQCLIRPTLPTTYAFRSIRLARPGGSVPYALRHSRLSAAFSTSTARRKDEKSGDKKFFDQTEPASEEEEPAKDGAKEVKEKDTSATESKKPEEKASAKNEGSGPAEGKGSSAGNSPASSGSGSSSDGPGDGKKRGRRGGDKGLQLPVSVPTIYPQVLAVPLAKRPLFPGFYKAITVKDPEVTSAIAEMLKRGQPYIGVFLLKDENKDDDVIRDMNDVYDVGVFAQITGAEPYRGGDGAVTLVLYPHRRIRLTSLVSPSGAEARKEGESTPAEDATPQKSAETEEKGDVVASFEESAVSPAKQDSSHHFGPTSFLKKYQVSLGNVETLTEEPYDAKAPVIRAIANEIVTVFRDVASINHIFRDQISSFSMSQPGHVGTDPAKLADFAAAVSAADPQELHEILASLNVEDRMHKALALLKKELMNAQLQSKISKDVENKISKRQREYWLVEQLKGIKRELGLETDGKDKLVEKFKERADKLAMPETVRRVFDEELTKLQTLDPAASEFNVTRNYLDWLTTIPWGRRSVENFDIQHAMTVLDEDHHGLKDVKDRILEFIAVGKLRGTVEGKILCFVGPPGVGKTSIGKSIARALNREYYRFSVGGLTDVSEIKGHRRTYVGALPGRIIQALKKCHTENPLVLIDEVDKIGKGYQGDPSSALLELLDPEQNNSFLDHYMDVPVDLSKVLFVCTANMTDTIPQPLLDRMEVIELSGYVADEKMAIAQRYLAPAAKKMSGLKEADVQLTPDAIQEIIKSYCRESGVRNLKKQIEKVYRKAALKIVRDIKEEEPQPEEELSVSAQETEEEAKTASESESSPSPSSTSPQTSDESKKDAASRDSAEEPTVKTARGVSPLKVPDTVHLSIASESLKEYIGPPVFTSDRLYDTNPPGVAMGLAWTQMGGSALYVESILQIPLRPDTRPSFEITGNLKSVMKESTTIACTFARAFMVKNFPDNHFFERAKMHMHIPDGAVPKDGPSAGITMTTSLLSLALNEPVVPDIAMTGELTLTGKVLRIGGLREKTVAARRAGCKMIIFPRDNLSDWLELPENIKAEIEGRPVTWYSEVFDLVFPNLDREAANKCRSCEWKRQNKAKAKREAEESDDDDD